MTFNMDKFERAAEAHFDRMLDEYLDECRACEDTELNESCYACGYGTYEIPCVDCGEAMEVVLEDPSEDEIATADPQCTDCRNHEWLLKHVTQINADGTRLATLTLPTKYTMNDEDGRWLNKFSRPDQVTLTYTPEFNDKTGLEKFSTDLYTGWGIGSVPKGLNEAVAEYLEQLRNTEKLEASR